MIVKNNYNECITNFACSIRKYFDLEYKHNTLEYIDNILNEYQPKNVVTILYDGMGTNIIDRVLDKESFLIKNRIKNITTVFPATTVAATTSILTGLNPVETGMLGWDIYYKEIDKIITTFLNYEKADPECKVLPEAKKYKEKYMITKSIMSEINSKGKYTGHGLFPFGKSPYKDLNDMYNLIEQKCNEPDKKYIYAYCEDPDSTMHELGTDCEKVKNIITDINNKVEQLSKKLKDTIIFIIADHGHKDIENIFLSDYPDILECLIRNTSLEPRAVNFFVKEEKKQEFVKLFNKYFSEDFDLYNKEEVINSKLFGDGTENPIFKDALGDFLAIAKTDKALLHIGNHVLNSHHAGYTEDEIMIPLIVINTKNI